MYPGQSRKSYDTPRHPWQAATMAEEVELIKTYGVRNKREVWKAETVLRNYRRDARRLLAEIGTMGAEANKHATLESEQILTRLKRYGLLADNADLNDILSLKANDLLERRLQTQVYRQGLAHSMRQARQFITHGHIMLDGRKATIPGMLVTKDNEMKIDYYKSSPLSKESHPERPEKVLAETASILDAKEE